MSNIRLIGLESIKIGEITATKAMATGASISTIVAIVPDSAHLIFESPGVTDLFVEEEDLPDMQVLGTAKKTLEFATRDMGTKVLIDAFGGHAAATVWSMAVTSMVMEERCVEALSKAYNGYKMKIQIPRASFKAGGDLRFTKTESGQISFTCDVMIPASSVQISPMVIKQVAE